MTDPNHTAICLLVDRSGSMSQIQQAAQDSINEFIKGQASAEGKRMLRLAHFDDQYQVVHPLALANRSPFYHLVPRGMTALYDAIGKGIAEFGEELSAMSEDTRPGTVIFAIMTDGMENSSREFTQEQVKSAIKQQTDMYNWNFVYLGANQDAILTAQNIGIPRSSAVTYTASNAGVRNVTDSLECYVVAAAAGAPAAFTDEDRERAIADD